MKKLVNVAALAVAVGFAAWGCSKKSSSSNTSSGGTAPLAKTYSLSVDATAGGTVTDGSFGINLSNKTQSFSIPAGSTVTLTAAAASGYVFSAWSGCTSTTDICTINNISANQSVTATFKSTSGLPTYTLTVDASPNGTVTSNPSGIDETGATVVKSFTSGTSVTLTATPASGYAFSSWSGACTNTTNTCTVTSTATVTANFVQGGQICVTASSGGSVTSSPSGISAPNGNNCVYAFPGTSYTLTESPDSSYTFSSWSGACSGTATTCTFKAPPGGQTTNVTANFASGGVTYYTLHINTSAGGTVTGAIPGNVNFFPASDDNGSGVSVASATAITLTASASGGGYAFAGWGNGSNPGTCTGTTNPCTFTISQDAYFNVNFSSNGITYYTLTLDASNGGTVTSSPSPCNTTSGGSSVSCPSNTSVTLTPTANLNYTFAGWSSNGNNNANCSGTGTCTFTMNQDETIGAPDFSANNTGTYTSYTGAWNYSMTNVTGTGTCSNPGTTESFTVNSSGDYSITIGPVTSNGSIGLTSGSFSDSGSSSSSGCGTDTSSSLSESGTCPAPTAGYSGPCNGSLKFTSGGGNGTITATVNWAR